jgi:3-phenylpropionate/cinnamic acid dioxygenase small subunit
MHAVTNILVTSVVDGRIGCRSNVALYRVNRAGESVLHVTGEYRDQIVMAPDGARFETHQVVLDPSTLPADMSTLL